MKNFIFVQCYYLVTNLCWNHFHKKFLDRERCSPEYPFQVIFPITFVKNQKKEARRLRKNNTEFFSPTVLWANILVRAHWPPFTLIFFLKIGLMCFASAYFLLYSRKSFLTCWFWDNNQLEPFQYKNFNKLFQCILKPLETFLIRNCFYSETKQIRQKKPGHINRFLNWKILNHFNNI